MKEENNFLALMIGIFGLPFVLISLLFGYRVILTVEKNKDKENEKYN